MNTDAPNFNGTYPLAGEKIGPAWRDAWAALSVDTWTDGTELALTVAPRHGLLPDTVKNLLRAARSVGLLEVARIRPQGRTQKAAHYRVIAPDGERQAKPVAITTGM